MTRLNPPEMLQNWKYKIEDRTVYTVYLGVATHALSFHSEIIHKMVTNLIDTGIMTYLAETHVLMFRKPLRNPNKPNFINLVDFLVLLVIFLGFCGFSAVIFGIELILNTKRFKRIVKFCFATKISKTLKFRAAKVHQDKNDQSCKVQKINSNIHDIFRVKNIKKLKLASNEMNLNVFGKKVDQNADKIEDLEVDQQKVQELMSTLGFIQEMLHDEMLAEFGTDLNPNCD